MTKSSSAFLTLSRTLSLTLFLAATLALGACGDSSPPEGGQQDMSSQPSQ